MSNRRKPSEIRFSQNSIKSNWKDNASQIGDTLDQLLKGEISVYDIPKITITERNGNLYSADNRRLWVFKKLEELGNCENIPVKYGYIDPRKFTSNNFGRSVFIRPRGSGDPGGRFWKVLERETMCSAFTANGDPTAIDNPSGLEARRSHRANEWMETSLPSEFANTIQIDDLERISLIDIGYLQTNPISDGEYLGELLDEWLQIDLSQHCWELRVFKQFGRYYTTENLTLWTLKTLKMFSKKPETKFTRTHIPFEETNDTIHLNSLNDSLKFAPNSVIGGSVWKNIDYLKQLPFLEKVILPVSDIYFTKGTIPDTYENKSIAKVLVDSNAAMKIPRSIRVVKFGEKYYALDNEILWVVKEMQRMRGSLDVSVEIKIEMDPPLFRGFMSENIQEVTIEQTTFSHTNEETFIFECMKKIPPTRPLR